MKRATVFGVIVCHQLHAGSAWACGAVAELFEPLLPMRDAADVALDAALFVAISDTQPITVELLRANAAGEDVAPLSLLVDAGVPTGDVALDKAPPRDETTSQSTASTSDGSENSSRDEADVVVPLDVVCYGAVSGNLCVAKPKEPLEAQTRYSWTASKLASAGEEVERVTERVWFTTGNAFVNTGSSVVDVEVTEHRMASYFGCGPSQTFVRYVGLELEAATVTTPIVANVKGITPNGSLLPLVLNAEEPKQSLTLSAPPECFVIETFNAAGLRTELAETCPEAVLPVTSDVSEAVPAAASETTASDVSETESAAQPDEGAEEEDGVERRSVDGASGGGCAVTHNDVGRSTLSSVWTLAAALVIVRRRARRS
jgi:hypothetical protein